MKYPTYQGTIGFIGQPNRVCDPWHIYDAAKRWPLDTWVYLGGTTGIDLLVRTISVEKNIRAEIVQARPDLYGSSAKYVQYAELVQRCQLLYAVYQPIKKSNVIERSIKLAERYGRLVRVVAPVDRNRFHLYPDLIRILNSRGDQ